FSALLTCVSIVLTPCGVCRTKAKRSLSFYSRAFLRRLRLVRFKVMFQPSLIFFKRNQKFPIKRPNLFSHLSLPEAGSVFPHVPKVLPRAVISVSDSLPAAPELKLVSCLLV